MRRKVSNCQIAPTVLSTFPQNFHPCLKQTLKATLVFEDRILGESAVFSPDSDVSLQDLVPNHSDLVFQWKIFFPLFPEVGSRILQHHIVSRICRFGSIHQISIFVNIFEKVLNTEGASINKLFVCLIKGHCVLNLICLSMKIEVQALIIVNFTLLSLSKYCTVSLVFMSRIPDSGRFWSVTLYVLSLHPYI